jgi:hypothetical protein
LQSHSRWLQCGVCELKTSKFKPKAIEQPVQEPASKPKVKFPVIHERHPYLKIVLGDIQSLTAMFSRKPIVKQEKYDALSAAYERGRRGVN